MLGSGQEKETGVRFSWNISMLSSTPISRVMHLLDREGILTT